MLTAFPRTTLLPAGALAAVLALSGCTGDGSTSEGAQAVRPVVDSAVKEAAKQAPAPAKELPAPVKELVTKTDVGQFFVTPSPEMPPATVDSTIAKLKTLDGVQSVERTAEGQVDVVLRPAVQPKQREAIVKQLAALGEVQEGI